MSLKFLVIQMTCLSRSQLNKWIGSIVEYSTVRGLKKMTEKVSPLVIGVGAPPCVYNVAGYKGCPFYERATTHARFVCDEAKRLGVAIVGLEIQEFETRDTYFEWLNANRDELKIPNAFKTSPAVWKQTSEVSSWVGGFEQMEFFLQVDTGGRIWKNEKATKAVKFRVVSGVFQILLAIILGVVLCFAQSSKGIRVIAVAPMLFGTMTAGQVLFGS